MKVSRNLACLLTGLSLCLTACAVAQAGDLPQEYVSTTPVLANGVLYVASSNVPQHRGHLRAIDIHDTFPVTLWDAAERMPLAGIGTDPGEWPDSDPPAKIQTGNLYRSLFTNLADQLLPLTLELVDRLQPVTGAASRAETELLLHAVRGRRGGTLEQVSGLGEDPQRLWGLSRSSPILVGRSVVSAEQGQRDQVLYCGAEDGMLHAFFVSRWREETEDYLIDDADGGKELWAYLPGSFLPYLGAQPLSDSVGELAVHLDGSPLVGEFFLDLDGDGLRSWHTLLVATGTILQQRKSCLFVMDVSDPYRPQLLWEKILPGNTLGRTRGVVVDRCGSASDSSHCVYLTADSAETGHPGVHALAVTLATGQGLWRFSAPYQASGPVAEATPAVPALMDIDGNGRTDTLVFGDLIGQLWALNLDNGHAYGGAPVFVVPGGDAEPIGAGVTVQGSMAFFGTGGVESSESNYQYAVYAVQIEAGGARLRWRYPLAPGEKLWERPLVDTSGNLVFGTAIDYLSLARSAERPTSGRIVSLNREGGEGVSHAAEAATLGRVVTAPGVIVSVALTGEVTQFGTAGRLTGPAAGSPSVKILSWRQR